MKLYEIQQELYDLYDEETGEFNKEKFEKLSGLIDQKLEGIALGIKNLTSDIEALKKEEDKLKERRRVKENSLNSSKEFLSEQLNGKTLETARVKISWKSSEAVEILDEGAIPACYLKPAAPTVKKADIKTAIKAGMIVPGAVLVSRNNMQIN